MYKERLLCPICGAEMVERQGANVKFYGCSNYFKTGCMGKRDIQGESWGCDDEPWHLNDEGSNMFSACISDGFSYDEAAECATEWQRLEEKDHWK